MKTLIKKKVLTEVHKREEKCILCRHNTIFLISITQINMV